MQPEKRIAVVLVNWNSQERTVRTLKKISEWTEVKHDVLIVDNNSDEDIEGHLNDLAENVYLIKNSENLGFSGGCNVALRSILAGTVSPTPSKRYSYILLLNTDAWIPEKDLIQLLTAVREEPLIGAVGPVLASRDEKTIISVGGRDPCRHVYTYNGGVEVLDLVRNKTTISVDYVPGTVALISVKALSAVGLFDERYFFSCEMADLCMRFRRKGYRCKVVTRAQAWHDLEEVGEKRRNTLYLYYQLRNRFLLVRKWRTFSRPVFVTYWILIGMRLLCKSFVLGDTAMTNAVRCALKDGIIGRYGSKTIASKF